MKIIHFSYIKSNKDGGIYFYIKNLVNIKEIMALIVIGSHQILKIII